MLAGVWIIDLIVAITITTFSFIIMTNIVDHANIMLCGIIVITIIVVIIIMTIIMVIFNMIITMINLNDIMISSYKTMLTSYSFILCIGSDIMTVTFVIIVLGNLIVQCRK